MSTFTRITTTTLGLALLAGCATNKRSSRQPAEPQASAPPVKAVDPWAKSVTAAPSTPVKTAEAGTTGDNTATAEPPAPVTPAAEPAASATGQRTHTVAKGETLYAISVKYYGTGSKWPKIVDANPGLKPERMPVGKQIVIP